MQVAVERLADVKTDAELQEALRAMMRGGGASTRGLRTFIVELDNSKTTSAFPEVEWKSRPTGIDGVMIMESRYVDVDIGDRLLYIDRRDVEECELYLDRRGGRLGLLHADMTDKAMQRGVELLARTTRIKRACVLPSVLKEYTAGGNGTSRRRNGNAPGLVSIKRNDADGKDYAAVEAKFGGMFASRGGTSIEAHIGLVNELRERYLLMLTELEKCRQGFPKVKNSYFVGKPVECTFSKRIENIKEFANELFDGKPPLRMFGRNSKVTKGQYIVPVADMEAGVGMDVDITHKMLLINMPLHHSASSAMRLMAHIQQYHDDGFVCHDVTAGGHGG